MKIRKLPSIFAGLLLVLGMSATVYSSGRKSGPNNAYIYQVIERKDGSVEATIHIIPDPESTEFQKYLQANYDRIQQLIGTGGDLIEIQVTLKQPLPTDEIRDMATKVGLRVESFLLVGNGPEGEKVSSIIYGDLSEIPSAEIGPRGQSVVYLGVMLLQGRIAPTVEGLGQLSLDERVYLADTTLNEVRSLIQRDSRLSGKQIESISAPSPFWDLMWEQP